MTNFRALCTELLAGIDGDCCPETQGNYYSSEAMNAITRVRAALDEPGGEGPKDEELLESAAKALGYKHIPSDETCLTTEAGELLAFAHAVLARWGRPVPAPKPIPVSERPWERDGWRDPEGRCWFCNAYSIGRWNYQLPPDPEQDWGMLGTEAHCLPHWAIARPRPEAKEPT
jgi:hypothetical protein